MSSIKALELGAFAVMTAFAAGTASAGLPITPAPVLGAGAGALALLGIGYYGIKRLRGR